MSFGETGSAEYAAEEWNDDGGDLVALGLQREMAGIDEVNLGVRIVAAEGFGARRQEERIVLAPDREQVGGMLAEVGLKLGIQRHVRRVVEKQIELDLVIARAVEQRLIQRVGFRRDHRGVMRAMGVLPFGGARLH